MAQLSRQAVYDLARQAGLAQFDAATAGAICDAESGRETLALGVNHDPYGRAISRDRGLWQINDAAHPDVSDQCAFNQVCNARAMARISSNGSNWRPWTTFNTGAYRGFLPFYLQIAGFAHELPPPAPDVVGQLQLRIQQGYPFWKAVFEAFEGLLGGRVGSQVLK